MNKLTISIIILILVIIGGVGAYFIFQKAFSLQPLTPLKQSEQQSIEPSLFGTKIGTFPDFI